MRFLGRADYIVLALLLALNIVLRIPWSPHGEDVVDSTFVWSLANSISSLGYIKWALHPLSFFGLYPLSYPSAAPVVLSVTSQLTGVDMEYTILAYGIFLSVLGMFGSYVMAMKIRSDYLFAFITSFVFSTAPVFVEYTRWTATSRNLFLALFPLFLWAAFWYNKKENYINKQILLIIILLVTLGATHRVSFLLIFAGAAYALTNIILYAKDKPYVIKYTSKLSENTRFFALILLCVIMFSLQFSSIGFYKGIWEEYKSGAFTTGHSPPILLLNMLTNYTGSIGILVPFGFIGFLMLLRKSDKKFNDFLIMIIIMFSTAILALGLYVSMFLLPFVSLLIALCICRLLGQSVEHLYDQKNKHSCNTLLFTQKAPAIIMLICLLTSICFSYYIINRHMYLPVGDTGDKDWMTSEPFIGMFLKERGETTFLSNDGLIFSRIYASTDIPPLQGGIFALVNSWMKKEDLNITAVSISSIRFNSDALFSINNFIEIDKDSSDIFNLLYQSSRANQILNKYNVNYLVTNKKIFDGIFEGGSHSSPSRFMKSFTGVGSRIYDNNAGCIWDLRR